MPYAGSLDGLTLQAIQQHAEYVQDADPEVRKISRGLSVQDMQTVMEYVRRVSQHTVKTAPNGGYGWVVVGAMFLLHFLCCGTLYTLSVYYPVFLEDFSIPASTGAWISAVFFGFFFMCGPLAGHMVDKIGTQWTAAIGCFVASAGLLIASFVPYFSLVIVFLSVVGGIGTGSAVLASVTAVVRWFHSKRGLAIGVGACGSGIGAACFSPLVTSLTAQYDWRGCMLIQSAIVLNGCIFAYFLRPLPYSKPRVSGKSKGQELPLEGRLRNVSLHESNGTTSFATATPSVSNTNGTKGTLGTSQFGEASSNTIGTRSVIEKPSNKPADNDQRPRTDAAISAFHVFTQWKFWMFCVSQFFIFFAINPNLVFLVSRALNDCEVSKIEASALVGVMGAGSVGGRLFFGAFAGRLKRRKFWPFALSMLVVGVTTMAVTASKAFVGMLVFSAISGLGYGTMVTLTSIVLVDFFGVSFIASAYGNLVFFRGLGFLAGPPIGGAIVARYGGSHTELYLTMGAIMTAGGLIVTALPLIEKLLLWRSGHWKPRFF